MRQTLIGSPVFPLRGRPFLPPRELKWPLLNRHCKRVVGTLAHFPWRLRHPPHRPHARGPVPVLPPSILPQPNSGDAVSNRESTERALRQLHKNGRVEPTQREFLRTRPAPLPKCPQRPWQPHTCSRAAWDDTPQSVSRILHGYIQRNCRRTRIAWADTPLNP